MIEPSNAELSELQDCSRQYIADLEVENDRLERGNAGLIAALNAVLNHPLSHLSPVTEGIVRSAIAKARGE
jgi:hypothetical protein